MVAMRMSTVGKSSRMVGTQPLATRMTGSFRGHSAAGIMNNSLVNQRKSAKVCAASGSKVALATADVTLSLDELKSLLEDTLWGTGRGLSANSDIRAEVTDLVSQLEAKTPISEPNESLDTLGGEWKLVYTSNSELMPLLALGRLPLVEVGDVTQKIDAASGSVENKVEFTVPFSKTSIGSTARFDVRSPKLLEIQFTDGKISTPEIMSDFELPDTVDVAGQVVDLSGLKSALQPLDGPVRSVIQQAGTFLAGQPDFTFKTPTTVNGKTRSTWLLNTYLDEDLRIARGDGGSLFIMKKSPMLELPEKVEIEEDVMPEPVQPTEFSSSKEEEPEVKVEDPLEEFCEEDPSADECRVYED